MSHWQRLPCGPLPRLFRDYDHLPRVVAEFRRRDVAPSPFPVVQFILLSWFVDNLYVACVNIPADVKPLVCEGVSVRLHLVHCIRLKWETHVGMAALFSKTCVVGMFSNAAAMHL